VRGHTHSGNPSHPLSLPDLFGQSRKRTGFSAHPSLDQETKDDTRKPCSKTTGNSQVKSGDDKGGVFLEICVILCQINGAGFRLKFSYFLFLKLCKGEGNLHGEIFTPFLTLSHQWALFVTSLWKILSLSSPSEKGVRGI